MGPFADTLGVLFAEHNGTHLSEGQIQLLRRALGQTDVVTTPAAPDEYEVIQVHATNPERDETQTHQPQSSVDIVCPSAASSGSVAAWLWRSPCKRHRRV